MKMLNSNNQQKSDHYKDITTVNISFSLLTGVTLL